MLTTAGVVSLIMALGWLVLNWRASRSDVQAAGWSKSTQVQMALLWVVIIALLALFFERFQP